mmetsp:Transcript_39504/g.86152  ORF Transcript_39504/g.86152 Transcript_39504/m.86152 type:complete len:256 (-) Transcript_39504:1325-2092(-)
MHERQKPYTRHMPCGTSELAVTLRGHQPQGLSKNLHNNGLILFFQNPEHVVRPVRHSKRFADSEASRHIVSDVNLELCRQLRRINRNPAVDAQIQMTADDLDMSIANAEPTILHKIRLLLSSASTTSKNSLDDTCLIAKPDAAIVVHTHHLDVQIHSFHVGLQVVDSLRLLLRPVTGISDELWVGFSSARGTENRFVKAGFVEDQADGVVNRLLGDQGIHQLASSIAGRLGQELMQGRIQSTYSLGDAGQELSFA